MCCGWKKSIKSNSRNVLIDALEQSVRVPGTVVLDHFFRIAVVYGHHVFIQHASWLRFYFLNLFQSAAGDKQPSSFTIVWQHL